MLGLMRLEIDAGAIADILVIVFRRKEICRQRESNG